GSAVDPTEINITVVTNDPELTLNPDGTVSVDPSATLGTYTLEYQICEVANPTNCDTATVTITVLQQELVIYNAISPNNDGVNDSFLIQGLENYPDNEVEIYNRWGTKVYAARSYNNTSVAFNGYSNVDRSLNQNEGLPSGTYFYIIKYTDNDGNSVNKTGYLYLN
ncbi:gliding motility-associated C-terminal domain-containing protein, partial [Flavobacterium sp. U410]